MMAATLQVEVAVDDAVVRFIAIQVSEYVHCCTLSIIVIMA